MPKVKTRLRHPSQPLASLAPTEQHQDQLNPISMPRPPTGSSSDMEGNRPLNPGGKGASASNPSKGKKPLETRKRSTVNSPFSSDSENGVEPAHGNGGLNVEGSGFNVEQIGFLQSLISANPENFLQEVNVMETEPPAPFTPAQLHVIKNMFGKRVASPTYSERDPSPSGHHRGPDQAITHQGVCQPPVETSDSEDNVDTIDPISGSGSDGHGRLGDKAKEIPPPTAYWIGFGKEPNGVGKVCGSREKFIDCRYRAQEEAKRLEDACRGNVPITRYAKSHLLIGLQLKEIQRLWKTLASWRGSDVSTGVGPDGLECQSGNASIIRHLGAAIQLGVDAARHEVAMAEVFESHGPEVVAAMEGRSRGDPRYNRRAEFVLKEMKRARLEDALLKPKSNILPHAAPLVQKRIRSKFSRFAKVPYKTAYQSYKKGPDATRSCFICSAPNHFAKFCPKKKN